MEADLTVVTLAEGDLLDRCAALRETVAGLAPGATLYVSGSADLPEVLDRVSTPELTPWHLLAGPIGIEAWARKEGA